MDYDDGPPAVEHELAWAAAAVLFVWTCIAAGLYWRD
jgi:hypothetical protein